MSSSKIDRNPQVKKTGTFWLIGSKIVLSKITIMNRIQWLILKKSLRSGNLSE